MTLVAIDGTNVLDTLIITLPAIIAAIYAGLVHRQIKTPSGTSIGSQVESSHLTAIANNWLLSDRGGETKKADPDSLLKHGRESPQVPDTQAPPPQA